MKKLYSLFAAIICAASLSAQNMTVTIDGHSIANGSTYEKYYAEEELDDMDVYGLYPKFILTSKVNGNCEAALVSVDKADDVAFCFNGCVFTGANNNYTVNHTGVVVRKDMEYDLGIHVQHDNKWTENYTRELNLTLVQKGETFTCKIILGVDPEKAAGINGVGSKKTVSFANNTLTFNIASAATVSLYSVTGSEVLKKDISTAGSISLSTLPKGVYIYKVNGASKTYTGKVVVK
jgi:hypothetical protein